MDIKNRRAAQDMIRLDGEGNWFQSDFPILHDRTVQFLYRNIALDSEGKFYLTGEDKPIYIHVEDVPYWVVKVERTIAGYLITLTDGSIELLDFENIWSGKNNALYCLVKGGRFAAKFFRGPYYEVSKDIRQEGKKFILAFGRKEYPIATVPPKSLTAKKKVAPAKKSSGPSKKAAKKKPASKKAVKKTAKKPVKKAVKKAAPKKAAPSKKAGFFKKVVSKLKKAAKKKR